MSTVSTISGSSSASHCNKKNIGVVEINGKKYDVIVVSTKHDLSKLADGTTAAKALNLVNEMSGLYEAKAKTASVPIVNAKHIDSKGLHHSTGLIGSNGITGNAWNEFKELVSGTAAVAEERLDSSSPSNVDLESAGSVDSRQRTRDWVQQSVDGVAVPARSDTPKSAPSVDPSEDGSVSDSEEDDFETVTDRMSDEYKSAESDRDDDDDKSSTSSRSSSPAPSSASSSPQLPVPTTTTSSIHKGTLGNPATPPPSINGSDDDGLHVRLVPKEDPERTEQPQQHKEKLSLIDRLRRRIGMKTSAEKELEENKNILAALRTINSMTSDELEKLKEKDKERQKKLTSGESYLLAVNRAIDETSITEEKERNELIQELIDTYLIITNK